MFPSVLPMNIITYYGYGYYLVNLPYLLFSNMTFVINYVILMNTLKINEINGFLYYNPKRKQDNEDRSGILK